jgi:hypothetical protein
VKLCERRSVHVPALYAPWNASGDRRAGSSTPAMVGGTLVALQASDLPDEAGLACGSPGYLEPIEPPVATGGLV